jgi:hypothetical protein
MNAGLRRWQRERREVAVEAERLDALWVTKPEVSDEHRRAVKSAGAARRRATEMQRTPAWGDRSAIAAVYAEAHRLTATTGVPHQVDHEIPLQGQLVSGLHVHNNLRAIPAVENARKHNRFEIES